MLVRVISESESPISLFLATSKTQLSLFVIPSAAETRNESKNPEGKSGYCVSDVIERQISPLRAASRPSGRNDKSAKFNHNWYYSLPGIDVRQRIIAHYAKNIDFD